MTIMRYAYFLAVICSTVLATNAYFDYRHGQYHMQATETD